MRDTGLFEKTRSYWNRRYGKELSTHEVEEIQGTLTGFFDLLIRADINATSGSWATSGASGC